MLGYIKKYMLGEWTALKADKRTLLILCLGPLVLMLFLGSLYYHNALTNIRSAVLDLDGSSLSRNVIRGFGDSDKFNIVLQADNEYQLREAMEREQIQAAIVIPEDFHDKIKHQQAAQVLIIANGANIVYANAAVAAANEIVQTFNAGAGIKVMEGKGFVPQAAKNVATLISFSSRVWYNPTYAYSNFLLLGILGVIIQQLVVLYGASTVIRDKENQVLTSLDGGWQELVGYTLGKMIPYGFIEIGAFLIGLLTLLYSFHIPFRGSVLAMLVLLLLFVIGLCAIALFFSVIARTEKEAIQIAMIFATPSFFLSGFTWPLEAMPSSIRFVAQLMPLTYFINPLRRIALMGVDWSYVYKDAICLLLTIMVYYCLAFILLKRKTSVQG